MGPYLIPRDTKGEGRILYIFSKKAIIYTGIGLLIGGLIYKLFALIGLWMVGIVILGILAIMGFIIGTCKMPNSTSFDITRKTGGENIDEIIWRAIKFKMTNKKKIYIYTKEEK